MSDFFDRKTKRMAALLIMVSMMSLPIGARQTQAPVDDWCEMARKFEYFAAMNAFAFALIPPLQPVAIIFGGVALAIKGFQIARPNCR